MVREIKCRVLHLYQNEQLQNGYEVININNSSEGGQGSLTIRPFSSPLLKNMLVNCSTLHFY